MSDMTCIEERFRMANPIPDPANPPLTAATPAAVLLDLEKKRGTMQPRENASTTAPPPRRWNGPLVAAAAFAAVIIVGVGILLASGGDDEEIVATTVTTQAPPTTATTAAPTTTTAATTTLPPPALTVEEAFAVSDAYFAAYEAGDVEAMMALFTPDATYSGGIGPSTREERRQLLAYKVAEGTAFTARECSVFAESATDVTLTCRYGQHEYLAQAVNGPVVPHTMTMVVTPAGVTRLADIFGDPSFNTVYTPFAAWMAVHHPEDAAAVEFGNWSSIEEAGETGLLVAEYADEWASYLEENGCTFEESC